MAKDSSGGSPEQRTRSQIKRMKKREKKKKKPLDVHHESAGVVVWEMFDDVVPIQYERANVFDEAVVVSEVLVLDDYAGRKPIMDKEEEATLRTFLKTLDITDKPIETIPDEIFQDFVENEELAKTKETIRNYPKTSPKARRKETPAKLVAKIIEPKVLYSYSGLPILTPSIVTMEDLTDGVVLVHCSEDRGFQPMDVIPEENSELSDTSSEKKRLSGEGGAVQEQSRTQAPQSVEIVLVEDDTNMALNFEGIKFIEEESGSSHAADDYEADVESAVESRRDTVVLDDDDKTSYSRQDSTSSVNTAKYLPPYSRSESDEWKSSWKPDEILEEISELAGRVSVKKLRENLECDIQPILVSKLAVMDCCNEPNLREIGWIKILDNTKKAMKRETSFENKEVQTVGNPKSLALLAKEVLLALPNGLFLSRKIGISLSCPSSPPRQSPFRRYSDTETCSELQYYNNIASDKSVVEFSCRGSNNEDNWWYGMATKDPALFLGLSTSQVDEFSRTQHHTPTQDEAENLLDLHQKFMERRSYADSMNLSRGRNLVFDSTKDLIDDGHVEQGGEFAEERQMVEPSVVDAAIRDYTESGATANPCVLAHNQNATTYDQSAADLKRNVSAAGARRGHTMDTSKQECLESVGRLILDRFMNNGVNSVVAEGSTSIVTEKFPSVSDVIKAFETPSKPDDVKPAKEGKESNYITDNYAISKNRDIAVIHNEDRRRSLTQEEVFKQQMYEEYMSKLAERVERRQQNSIKISNQQNDAPECKTQGIEEEFINKVWERQGRSKSKTPLSEDQLSSKRSSIVVNLDSDLAALPKHLQEFFDLDSEGRRRKREESLLKEIDEALVHGRGFLYKQGGKMFSPTFKATAPRPGVWSPAQPTSAVSEEPAQPNPVEEQRKKIEEEPIPPVWTPRSAHASPVAERKEFRPVNFESPTFSRKNLSENKSDAVPPWQQSQTDRPVEVKTNFSTLPLPRAPNPTVTLLQKAREGHIPRGAQYLTDAMPDQDRNEYQPEEILFTSKDESERSHRIELGPKQPVSGIGPTTKEGIPIVLRSEEHLELMEVNEDNKERWYKRMYESLHRPGKDEDYVTVKYRTSPRRRGLYGYHGTTSGGYQSEPEPVASDDRSFKYATLDRRRTQKNKENEVINVTLPRNVSRTSEPYKIQPGRIENYQTGHSSITDLEANKWWDEVLEIFDRWLDANPGADGRGARQILAHALCKRQAEKSQPVHKTHSPKSFMTYALKESGYDSDPQHVFTKRDEEFQTPLSPQEQREAYKTVQKGGEVPLKGLRKPAPERPKDDTEIEYFPLSPTLTRIRVHKQNITPLSGFPFPFPYQLPLVPIGVCSSYSQVQLYPTPEATCTKKGSVYQFTRPGTKLQTIGETSNSSKVTPKPRTPKTVPVYENLPIHSEPKTFADLKRKAPSLVEKTKKTQKKSKKVPLSESVRREKPLSKVQRRLKTLPEQLKKRKSESKDSELKRRKQEFDASLSDFVEAELGPGFLSDTSEMNPIFDGMNPQFVRKEADYPPYRSRSYSPASENFVRKPSPPQRESSRNNSTLRMWSKMMVTYPYPHRSRIETFDSNVKYLQEKIQRKLSNHEEEFGDDVETVRTVKKNRDGQMSIKTNRYVKIRPVSAGPVLKTVYDQNGRRVLTEAKKSEEKVIPKKAGTLVKSSTSYSMRSKNDEDKGKVKVTVAISSKGKENLSRKTVPAKKPASKILSPSTSVSSIRSVSVRSVPSERSSSAVSKVASPRVLSPSSTVSRVSSVSRASSTTKKTEPKKAVVKKPVTITKEPKKLVKKVVQTKPVVKKQEVNDKSLKEELDLVEQGNQIRSDCFFQHLFLREPVEKKEATVERSTSVLERARNYQRNIERSQPKPETSNLNLVKVFLTQKRPVSSSRFKNMDQELSRSPSPSYRSRSFQSKLRRFDSGSQFGDDLISFSPDLKVRSLSEPPIRGETPKMSPASSTQRITKEPPAKRYLRARSAGDAESSRRTPTFDGSTSSLHDHPEYQQYIMELLHSTKKSDRFRELHKFYVSLERMAELEKTASIGDLRPRLRNEEIIDYDRWKKLRTKERAEAELKALVGKLSEDQKEKDLVFRTADVVKWKGDRGLRAKERSVEDLKEQFIRYSQNEGNRRDFSPLKDNYKPLWRGNSIVNLATNLNTTAASHRGRPVTREELAKIKEAREKITTSRVRKNVKNWSSLSRDEVTALKSQLSEIYSQDVKKKSEEAFVVAVPEDSDVKSPGEKNLMVRCTSLLGSDDTLSAKKETHKKSKSISSISDSKKDALTVKKKAPVLSEGEKKRLSLTLSKEVLEKVVSSPKRSPKETMSVPNARGHRNSPDAGSPRTCYSFDVSEDGKVKNDFLLVLTPTEKDVEKAVEDWANGTRKTSAVELESVSASSETSVKTVIKNPVDVLKKVEYYEELSHTDDESTRQPRSRSAPESLTVQPKITPAYSLENIKEMLGEEKKFVPFVPKRAQSSSPCDWKSSDSMFSFRSRSVSPDPTKYYRAYLRTIRDGSVRKICKKFESSEDLSAVRDRFGPMKKSASDPELTRDMLRRYGTDTSRVVVRQQEVGDVQWLRSKYENSGRGRSRVRRSPIPRAPFTVSDRFMPRINVISKTAELQLQNLQKQTRLHELPASPEPFHSLTEYTQNHGGYYYVGEVEKLKRKFEKLSEMERMSLMGQMYTSTPDMNELRDIAPYLGCSWVAHQHSSPEPVEKRQLKPRPHSSSPIRPKQLPSILKTYPSGDIFANQKFDPLIHRPKYRYQPEPISYSYDRRLRWAGDWRHWNKPTVTFKEIHFRSDLNFPEEILESPRKYVESEVTIHYRSPVRSEAKEILSEEELARRQAEAMRRIYQEERRRKYLQELQDMNSRRHTDHFTASQKSPIPLNRYDDFGSDLSPGWGVRDRTPEPRLLARALFTFVGQSPRELSFRRGDIIHIRRQIDKNWCEGELGARVGLFPVNYVEIYHQDGGLRTTPNKPTEGQARAKFNFIAQSHLELSLVKGELVVLNRRVDDNWYEGRVGNRRGIFPVSYVEVLIPPGGSKQPTKPVASPAAHSLLLNGGTGQQSMGAHHYVPPTTPANFSSRANNQALHIDTQSEPLLYRVLYSYKPVNTDELELHEGDTVLVMEKCDDGWFVGSSQKTGHFGTFPGNYVQRI